MNVAIQEFHAEMCGRASRRLKARRLLWISPISAGVASDLRASRGFVWNSGFGLLRTTWKAVTYQDGRIVRVHSKGSAALPDEYAIKFLPESVSRRMSQSRHEAGLTSHSFGDKIVLVRVYKRLHKLGRDEPHFMALLEQCGSKRICCCPERSAGFLRAARISIDDVDTGFRISPSI